MRVGIFGGAFNPPHIGHTNAAKTAIDEQQLDLLIVIPTGTSPHKEMPQGTPPPEARLEMSKNAFSSIAPNVQISDMEVFSKQSNYTIDTIRAIQQEYGSAELFLLVGNDMYETLDTWKDSEALLQIVKPVLLPRDVIDISSTQIRQMLAKREGMPYICPENYELIIRHRLYRAKPNWDWLRDRAHAMLDPARIQHVKGCEQVAVQLAEHWGVNVDDAREAAILHDITKKLDFDTNMCIIAESELVTNNYSRSEEKLLHSLTASIIAKTIYGVSDEVAVAIKNHTTGAAGMTMLDKVIYLADYIEPTRDFPGLEEMRTEAFRDIDKAMILGLQMAVDDLTGRGIPIDNATLEALAYLNIATSLQTER